MYLIMKPFIGSEESDLNDTNRELWLEIILPGNVVPQNVPSSGAM